MDGAVTPTGDHTGSVSVANARKRRVAEPRVDAGERGGAAAGAPGRDADEAPGGGVLELPGGPHPVGDRTAGITEARVRAGGSAGAEHRGADEVGTVCGCAGVIREAIDVRPVQLALHVVARGVVRVRRRVAPARDAQRCADVPQCGLGGVDDAHGRARRAGWDAHERQIAARCPVGRGLQVQARVERDGGRAGERRARQHGVAAEDGDVAGDGDPSVVVDHAVRRRQDQIGGHAGSAAEPVLVVHAGRDRHLPRIGGVRRAGPARHLAADDRLRRSGGGEGGDERDEGDDERPRDHARHASADMSCHLESWTMISS